MSYDDGFGIDDTQQAVEDGDAYYCDTCNELSEGRFCARCHVGLCWGCDMPVVRGDNHGAGYPCHVGCDE